MAAYNDFDLCEESSTWIYIPIVPGERITGITRMAAYSSSAGMMVRVTHSITMMTF